MKSVVEESEIRRERQEGNATGASGRIIKGGGREGGRKGGREGGREGSSERESESE